MSNPTREEVERWLAKMEKEGTLSAPRDGWWEDLGEAYLRALDMRKSLEHVLEREKDIKGNDELDSIIRAFRMVFERFDDDSEEDPMLTEGQRRRRR